MTNRMLAWGATLWLAAGCAVAGPPGRAVGRDCDEPSRDVLTRQVSGIHVARFDVLEDVESWCAYWDEVHGIIFPPPPCDESLVDFDSEIVVAVALGPRSNLCYSVAIPCVQRLGVSEHRRLHVVETVPDDACACALAIAFPVAAVAIPRTEGHLMVRSRIETLDCEEP